MYEEVKTQASGMLRMQMQQMFDTENPDSVFGFPPVPPSLVTSSSPVALNVLCCQQLPDV